LFQVLGTANNTAWSWAIRMPCCANVAVTNVPGLPVGSSANALAQAFCNSINAACPGAFQAAPIPIITYPGLFLVCVRSCTPTPTPWVFSIGPAGTPAVNQCLVYNIGTPFFPPTPLPTSGLCSFNPPIVELPYANADLNGNGVDDALDIMSGTSADLNNNGIPDEAETCQGPVVTTASESQYVSVGSSLTLSASATGSPTLRYQWSLNGVPLSGQTSSDLALSNLQAGQFGDYTLVITNACGTNTVGPITLAPPPAESPAAPVIRTMNLVGGVFQLTFATEAGQTYAIEYKDQLSDPSWTHLTTIAGDDGEQTVFDAPPLPQTRFYRARVRVP
jgi:hypothetical protein